MKILWSFLLGLIDAIGQQCQVVYRCDVYLEAGMTSKHLPCVLGVDRDFVNLRWNLDMDRTWIGISRIGRGSRFGWDLLGILNLDGILELDGI